MATEVTATEVVGNVATVFSEIKGSTNIADKFLKVINCTVDVAKNVLVFFENTSLPASLLSLTTKFTNVTGLVAAFNLIDRVYDWVVPQKCEKLIGDEESGYEYAERENDYAWKSWNWEYCGKELKGPDGKDINRNRFHGNGYNNPMKSISKVFLTIAHAVEFVKFFETLDLYTLGAASSVLGWVKNVVYIPASLFGIGSGAITLFENNANYEKVAKKVDNWVSKKEQLKDTINRNILIEHFAEKQKVRNYTIGTIERTIDAINDELEDKKESLKDVINQIESKDPEVDDIQTFKIQRDQLTAEIEKLERRVGAFRRENIKLQEKVEKYTIFSEDIKKIGEDYSIVESTGFFKYADRKVELWTKERDHTAAENKGRLDTKTWLDIANNVGKLVLGIVGIVGIVLGLTLNPWFLIAVAAGWAVTHGLNVAKEVYGNMMKPQPIHKPMVYLKTTDNGYVAA